MSWKSWKHSSEHSTVYFKTTIWGKNIKPLEEEEEEEKILNEWVYLQKTFTEGQSKGYTSGEKVRMGDDQRRKSVKC